MPDPKSNLKIVLGTMTFGEEGKEQARVHDLKTCKDIVQTFLDHGHCEADTARFYCGGTCEEYLGKIQVDQMGIKIQTKLYPTAGQPMMSADAAPISHSPGDLRKHLMASLKALGVKKLDMFYLHGPDRTTPYEVTLKAIDDLHKEGHFDKFAISNFMSWEVAEMATLCRVNNWVPISAYQGLYNVIHRSVEAELFPCLKKFGIPFYAYNPIAGGYLTGRYSKPEDAVEPGSRFDPDKWQGKSYRARYFNEANFHALEIIRAACEKHGLTMGETALRWMNHHSGMKKESGDAVIIGASNVAHIQQNLVDLEKGPLPESILPALNEAWQTVKGFASPYFH